LETTKISGCSGWVVLERRHDVKRPEAPGECNLLGRGHPNVAEQEQVVIEPLLLEMGEGGGIDRCAWIDLGHLEPDHG
jgi:hypothetical protein